MSLYLTNPVVTSINATGPGDFAGKLLSTLMTIGFVIGLVYFAFMFIRASIMWITAGGDKGQLESARSSIITSSIGLLILLGIIGIIDFAEEFLGIEITSFNLDRLRIQ